MPCLMEGGTCLSETKVALMPVWGGRIESALSGVGWSLGLTGSTSGSSSVASGSRRATAVASSRPVTGDNRPTRIMAKKKKDRLQRPMNLLAFSQSVYGAMSFARLAPKRAGLT